ncbi:MAG: site-specific DNA-methyltransferase, partial [Chloroflexi bacterium]|nr:site-specific DNA-methyltransferase [Chloroflexota bacterium]
YNARVELDHIYCADSRAMHQVNDNSVQLVVTSPPYNVGKEYAHHLDNMELRDYLAYLEAAWKECLRVLVPGGRIAINIANTSRKPYVPLNAYIARQMIELGFLMRGEIIWDKGASAGISTAWGSFARASNPTLRDVHEYILVFSKATYKLEESRGKESGIENLEFVEWTKSVWRTPQEELQDAQNSLWKFDTQSKRRNGAHSPAHPAPFPIDLPLRLVLLYTNIGDNVLDPFMGSGTTALAAKITQRHYIGYEISCEYCALAEERLAALAQPQVMDDRVARRKERASHKTTQKHTEKNSV